MIEALDETIKQLLVQKMPLNLAEVDVSFDVPNRDWSGSISKPTINVYLHDIRENVEQRDVQWYTERQSDGSFIKTRLGGRYDLSYLITAWTNNIEDEHRLLWYVLATLVRYPTMPRDILPEMLAGQPLPIQTKVAQSDGVLRNAADVWTALDNQLKPVLTYVTSISLDAHLIRSVGQVRSRFLRFYPPDAEDLSRLNKPTRNGANPPPVLTEFVGVGGYITDARQPGRPVQAEVVLLESGLNVRTDAQGRYSFSNVAPRPTYTLLVVAPGFATRRQEITIPASSYDLQLEPEVQVVGS